MPLLWPSNEAQKSAGPATRSSFAGDDWRVREPPASLDRMPRRPSPQAAGGVSHIKAFERTLWAVRYIIIVPVIAVAAAAVGVVIVTTLEAMQLVGSVQKSFGTGATG